MDDLAVEIDCKEYYEKFADHREITMFASICHLLNELHELGIYKRLRLCVKYDLKQKTIDEIASLNALVKFEVGTLLLNLKDNFAMSALRNIEELHVQKSTEINDIGATADNLVNLKLLYMNEADINSIMPFIRRARKMEMIKIDQYKAINLAVMNSERLKLPNAKKITLYVGERLFLDTIRRMQKTDLEMIKLQRAVSFESDTDFFKYYC